MSDEEFRNYSEVRRLAPGEAMPPQMPWPGRPVKPGEFPGFERSLALVVTDLARTWNGAIAAPELLLEVLPGVDGDAGISVRLPDQAWHADGGVPAAYYPVSGPDPVAAVAGIAQETIAELVRHVWPMCSEHDRGLHVRNADGVSFDDDYEDWPRSGPATWWCGGNGGHVVAGVGELANHVE